MIYNIESLLLEAENDGLKGAVKARDEHIELPSSGYTASGAQARTFFTTPFPLVEILEKINPAILEFSLSGHRGVPEPSQKSPRSGNTPHHEKIPHPRKIKILQITHIISWLGFY